MNKKAVSGVVIIVVIVGVAGILLFMNPIGNTSFHVEEQVPSDLDYLTLFFSGLEDTNLSISFVDDETLLYSIDIAPYEPTPRGDTFSILSPYSSFHSFVGETRLRSLNVTLGTGIPYTLAVWGDNLDSSIEYDNGALIDNTAGVGGEITYEATGTLLFTLTENVDMSTNFAVVVGGTTTTSMSALYLDIDLQTGVSGELEIGSIPISFVDRVGWTWDGFDSYDTTAGSPTVNIDVSWCDQIYAKLMN